jgi:adenylate cyclase
MKFRFRVTLLTILLGLLGITIFIVGLSSYFSARAVVHDLSAQILEQTSQRIDRRVEHLLDMAADEGSLSHDLIKIGQLQASDAAGLAAYWLEVMEVHPQLSNIYITLDATGDMLIVMRLADRRLALQELRRNSGTGKLELRNYWPGDYPHRPYLVDLDKDDLDQRSWPWYVEARKAGPGSSIWSEAYVFFNDVGVMDIPGVTYATGVYGADGTLVGVIGVDYDFYELSSFLKRLQVSTNGFAFLVERRRDGRLQVIGHPNADLLLRAGADNQRQELVPAEEVADPRVRAFMAQVPATLDVESLTGLEPVRFREAGVVYMGGYRRVGDMHDDDRRPANHPQWLICMVLPEDDVLGKVHRDLVLTALIGLGGLLFAIVTGVWVSGQVARPLEQLAREAEQIGHLQLRAHPPLESLVLEVDRLASATEEMKAGLRSFQKYVPSDLVRSLLASGQEARLGGERRTVTIHFSDIANFTTIAEGLAPEKVVEHLGEYLGALSEPIAATGGTVDKYIGDAIMAFWGAPGWNPQHARAACTAAVRNQEKLAELRQRWKAEGKPLFFTRIGINTGEVLVGNIGSDARFNYTVIGDAVNLASRLEGLNKHYGTEILITETTYQQAQPDVVARPIDWVSVKGRAEAVLVYELLGLKGRVDRVAEDLAELSEKALAAYRARDWARAVGLFEQVLQLRAGDGPAQLLIARCQGYQAAPPGGDWNGVHHMDSK